jgi:hypothetical protein
MVQAYVDGYCNYWQAGMKKVSKETYYRGKRVSKETYYTYCIIIYIPGVGGDGRGSQRPANVLLMCC